MNELQTQHALLEANDKISTVYSQRAIAVAVAAAAALAAGWNVARKFDESKNMWVVYIATPNGQIGWHIDEADIAMFAAVDSNEFVEWDGTYNSYSPLFGAEVMLNYHEFAKPLPLAFPEIDPVAVHTPQPTPEDEAFNAIGDNICGND